MHQTQQNTKTHHANVKFSRPFFFHCNVNEDWSFHTHSHSSLLDSGHGGQTRDKDGDEADGYDEGLLNSARPHRLWHLFPVIFPVDFKLHGEIIDDVNSEFSDLSFSYLPYAQEMHSIMVKSLPSGCRLTVSTFFLKNWNSNSFKPRLYLMSARNFSKFICQ